MGLFGKNKEEEVPSLPALPAENELVLPSKNDLPEVPTGLPEIETTELPALPYIEPKGTYPVITQPITPAQGMQKSHFDLRKPIKPLSPPETPIINEFEPEPEPINRPRKTTTKPSEPIYIRLDKFETTVETFEEIKNKIIEIEELLQKTKEIKQKEEQELTEWEREIQMIKTRIETIDKNIFNKLD